MSPKITIDKAIAERRHRNTSVLGAAVITRILPGENIEVASTGADVGSGDVTINALNGAMFTGSGGAPMVMAQNGEVTITHPTITNEKMTVTVSELVGINYETASTGRYGSAADYGVKRVNPTQTIIKKQIAGSASVIINIFHPT